MYSPSKSRDSKTDVTEDKEPIQGFYCAPENFRQFYLVYPDSKYLPEQSGNLIH